MFQMTEQDKNVKKKKKKTNLNKTELRNMPNKKFKGMIIKILTRLDRRVDELTYNINKDTENIFKNQSQRI